MSATAHLTAAPPAPPELSRADQLRAIADWLDQNPDAVADTVQLFGRARVSNYGVHTAQDLAHQVARIGGKWAKEPGEDMFTLKREIAPHIDYCLVTYRNQVCTRVVTGTETVTTQVPDPELVAALPTVERTETVETVEWQCGPILATGQAA